MDVVQATDSLMDAGLYVWAAEKRCSGGALGGSTSKRIQCITDVSTVVSSVSLVASHIVQSLNHCGSVSKASHQCSLAVLELGGGVAELTAASTKVASQCAEKSG